MLEVRWQRREGRNARIERWSLDDYLSVFALVCRGVGTVPKLVRVTRIALVGAHVLPHVTRDRVDGFRASEKGLPRLLQLRVPLREERRDLCHVR